MELSWNLKDLFKSNEECYKEIEIVKNLLSDIKKYEKEELNSKILFEMLEQNWNIKERTNRILVYGSLMYYKNINSDECIELKKQVEQFDNKVQTELGFVAQKITEIGEKIILEMIKENPKLEVYKLSIQNLFRVKNHIQNHATNLQIEKNKNDIQEQISKYNELLKNIKFGTIEIDGKEIEITTSNFAKYIAAKNRETRKQTYHIVNQAFMKNGKEFATILNNIYKRRNENAKLENYNSTLEKVLLEDNIDIENISTLINAVHNNLGLLQKYIKIKLKKLKIKDPKFYDIQISLNSGLSMKYTIEGAIEIIKSALKPLGNKYLETLEFLLNGHIDASPEETKHQTITFSWNAYAFMNFRNNYIDIKNLVHEIGHIANYQLSKEKLPYLYEDSTVFIGEIISTVNELLLNHYLYQNAKTIEEKVFYLSKDIENFITTIFSQTMYTEFEKIVYDLKEEQELSAELLSKQFESLLKQYYGDTIDIDDEACIEWTKIGKIYRWSFYLYKYATGLLIASSIADELLKGNSAMKEAYLNFLSAGSSLNPMDMLKLLGIDLKSSLENGFHMLEDNINKLEELLSSDY